MAGRYQFLDELRILAINGLEYADDPAQRARYERLFEIVCTVYAADSTLSPDTVRRRLSTERAHVTPKVAAAAAVVDETGRLLVVEAECEDFRTLPEGWVLPNRSPETTAERSVTHRTGIEGSADQLVDTYHVPADRVPGPHAAIVVLYLYPVSTESISIDGDGTFQHLEDVVDWKPNRERFARDACALWERSGAD